MYLKRFPRSPYWYASYIGPDGRRTVSSTRERQKERARQVGQSYERAARQANAGFFTARQARKVLARIYEIANREALPCDSIRGYFKGWIETVKVTHRHKTFVRYDGIIAEFLRWLGPNGDFLVPHLSSRTLAKFRDHYVKTHSPASTNTALDCIQAALSRAFNDDLLDINEAKRVERLADLPNKKQERRPFTDTEIKAIFKAVEGEPEWRGMVLCGLYHGFRLGDAADLCWSNVDLLLRQFRFDTEKTDRQVNVPIAEAFHRYLMEIAGDDPTGPLFPKLYALRRREVPTSALSNQFYRIMEKAAVVPQRTNKKKKDGPGRNGRRQSPGLGFHCFRYTATSLLKRAGVSDAVAREIIGHESAAISRIYTNIDTPTLRAAIDQMPDLT